MTRLLQDFNKGQSMGKLEELVQKYCPDGVEYVRLGDVLKVNRGKRLTKSQLSDDGQYPVYHGSKDTPLGKYTEFNVKGNTTIVVNTGGIGGVRFCADDFWCSDGSFWIGHSNLLNDRYVYYYLSPLEPYFASQKRVGGVPTIDRSVVENVEIPLPPLPVQEEIVRILDTFTELQAELQAEQQKRLQQYNYYRESILSFEGRSDVQWKKLGEICSIKARIGWQRLNKSEYLATGDYYLVTGVDIRGTRVNFQSCYYVSKERYEMDTNIQLRNGDIILTKDGTIGKVALIENMDKPGVLNSHLFVIRDISGYLLAKYLMYILLSNHFQSFVNKNKTQGTIPGLNQATIVKFELPIPSLEEQERIVDILDKFDTLTNNLAAGLPAEIEKRRLQYEFYRDKLLTFKRKEA